MARHVWTRQTTVLATQVPIDRAIIPAVRHNWKQTTAHVIKDDRITICRNLASDGVTESVGPTVVCQDCTGSARRADSAVQVTQPITYLHSSRLSLHTNSCYPASGGTRTVWSRLLLSSLLSSASVRTPTMPLATLSGCDTAPVLQSASACASRHSNGRHIRPLVNLQRDGGYAAKYTCLRDGSAAADTCAGPAVSVVTALLSIL